MPQTPKRAVPFPLSASLRAQLKESHRWAAARHHAMTREQPPSGAGRLRGRRTPGIRECSAQGVGGTAGLAAPHLRSSLGAVGVCGGGK